jgi:uncharacterized membrane protein required for colicin V production
MNIILIITGVIILLGVLNGLRKGLISSVFSVFALFAAMALAAYGGPYAAKFLRTTAVYSTVYDTVETNISEKLTIEMPTQTGEQIEAINQLPVPESIKKGLIENNNADIYQALGIDSFTAYMSDYISMLVINAIAYLLVFILAFIILKIICCMLNGLMELPILRGMNRLGGAIFGFCNSIMTIWLLFIVLTACSATTWGTQIMAQINDSQILTMMYDHNYLMNIIENISYIL